MADEIELSLVEDEVDEVPVDAIELPDDEADRVLHPPPPPPPPTPAQAARNIRAARSAKKKKTSAGFHEILFKPHEWMQSISRFVLYSGMTRNNPLIVTIRLVLLASPILFSIVLSWWTMSTIMGRGQKILSGGVAITRDGQTQMRVGGKTIILPVPEGMEPMSVEEYIQGYNKAAEAVREEGQNLLFAARPTDSKKRPFYFATAGVGSGPATAATSKEDFQKELRRFKEKKDNRGAVMLGSNSMIYPYDETPDSISYGVHLQEYSGAALIQYSCLVFTPQNRPVVINIGFSIRPGDGCDADREWCQQQLVAWRDRILAQ